MTVAEVERIGSPQISRDAARKAFLEYRHAVLEERDTQRKKEYDGLMKGYRAIAAGHQVIDLHQTMQAAGLQEETFFPKLAICRADAHKCHVEMFPDGRVGFSADAPFHHRRAKDRIVPFPAGTMPTYDRHWDATLGSWVRNGRRWNRDQATALVPIVPAGLHPSTHLRNYHIVWDAVWTPAPPKDPLLVKHLAGHLYAIVAHWDLTPLEQAVMRGRL
jgi:hypothetical protein